MHKHEDKYCPKCNELFICKVGDILNCQCAEIQLTEKTSHFLSKTNFDCLCKNCLSKLNEQTELASTHQFPNPTDKLIEGFHYYMEDGYFIFTEMYHMLRGFCCRNGCRHCVYGFKQVV